MEQPAKIIGWRTMVVLLAGLGSITALAWRAIGAGIQLDPNAIGAVVLICTGQAVSSYLKAKNGNGDGGPVRPA